MLCRIKVLPTYAIVNSSLLISMWSSTRSLMIVAQSKHIRSWMKIIHSSQANKKQHQVSRLNLKYHLKSKVSHQKPLQSTFLKLLNSFSSFVGRAAWLWMLNVASTIICSKRLSQASSNRCLMKVAKTIHSSLILLALKRPVIKYSSKLWCRWDLCLCSAFRWRRLLLLRRKLRKSKIMLS